jgi:D-sedoheptulose 7-phosphate isomerase
VTGVAARSGLAEIFAHQIRYLAAPTDIALGICADGDDPSVLAGLAVAKDLGLLTVALAGGQGGHRGQGGQGGQRGPGGAIAASASVDHLLLARSDDPCLVKEVQVTTYHVLWELVHVFFEQPGVLT